MSAKSHRARLRKMIANAQKDAQAGLVKAAARMEKDAEESIVSAGGVPSVPGQPPHNQTGALVAGITSGPMGDNGAHVTSSDPASASLEFGRSDAEARPFLRPAVQKNLGNVAKDVAEQVRISINRK